VQKEGLSDKDLPVQIHELLQPIISWLKKKTNFLIVQKAFFFSQF